MKTVHIVTKHSAHNFGAMLQAWSLQQTLLSLGYDCKILDYKKNSYKEWDSWKSARGVINNLLKLLYLKKFRLAYSRFEHFKNNEFNLTNTYTRKDQLYEIDAEPDVYISGSDQVWNPNDIDEIYYLDFVKKALKISYAASIGTSDIPTWAQDSFQKLLNKFDFISVRETNAANLVKKYTDVKNVDVNIDPVCLLDFDEWKYFENTYKYNCDGKYILCYFLYRPKWLNHYLLALHKLTGYKIVCVSHNPFRRIYHNKMICDIGPGEFITLIRNAELVISSSFHGIALSIANNKNFYAIVNPKMPDRLTNILKLFSLQNRIINSDSIPECSEIDYSKIKPVIDVQKKMAIKYLHSSIEATSLSYKTKSNQDVCSITRIGINCTGCGTCELICPKNAITMKHDSMGFSYPTINNSLCVNCGLCLKKCHTQESAKSMPIDAVYYAKNNDEAVRLASSSGGIFTALADYVLAHNGVVYGAQFSATDKKIVHTSTDCIGLERLRRSKYVESYLLDTFSKIQEDLSHGRLVLFCGTPCQCSGLRKLVGYNDLLITLDFFCHGVPSPIIFKEYLQEIETKIGATIVDYKFRSKNYGWSQYGVEISFDNAKVINTVGRCEWFFLAGMIDNLILRKSCYLCSRNISHTADITVGDFWGINKYNQNLNDDKGISIVVLNHNKDLFYGILKDKIQMIQMAPDGIAYTLKAKNNYAVLAKRNRFIEEYKRIGLNSIFKKYYKLRIFRNRLVFSVKKNKFKI